MANRKPRSIGLGMAHGILVSRGNPNRQMAVLSLILTLPFIGLAAAAAIATWPQLGGILPPDFERKIRTHPAQRFAPVVLVLASVAAAVIARYGLSRYRRWRAERELTRMSAGSGLDDEAVRSPTTEAVRRVADLAPPNIRWVDVPPLALRHKAHRGLLQSVRSDTNIIGASRLNIVYLRLFKNHRRQGTFMQGAWREFGPVSMLRSADSLTMDEIKFARSSGGLARLLTNSDQLLERMLDTSAPGQLQRGWHFVEAGISKMLVRDKYGAYPIRAMLCSDNMWKKAVHRLIDHADLVVLDLSGFRTEKHAGTRYELQTVFDRVPVERLILLADPMSRIKLLERAITDAWYGMAVDSPNAQRPGVEIWAAQVDFIRQTQNQDGGQQSWDLVARRSQTRELLTLIHRHRLTSAPPITPTAARRDPGPEVWPAPSNPEPLTIVGSAASSPVDRSDPGRRRSRAPWLVAAVLVVGAVVSLLAWQSWKKPLSDSGTGTTQSAVPAAPPSAARIALEPCTGWVIQAGAFKTQSEAAARADDVAALWPSIGDDAPVGWVQGSDCTMSPTRPELYFAVIGPFETEGQAGPYCHKLREQEIANADVMPWANDPEQMALYRRIGEDVKDC